MIDAFARFKVATAQLADDAGMVKINRVILELDLVGSWHQLLGSSNASVCDFDQITCEIKKVTEVADRCNQAVGHHGLSVRFDCFDIVFGNHPISIQVVRRAYADRVLVLAGDKSGNDLTACRQD